MIREFSMNLPSSKQFIDLTGHVYGRLTVESYKGRLGKHLQWICRCECGAGKVVYGGCLRSGNTRSCGCLSVQRSTTHGKSQAPEYRSYKAMKTRCYNEKCRGYVNYGGRGCGYVAAG